MSADITIILAIMAGILFYLGHIVIKAKKKDQNYFDALREGLGYDKKED